MEILKVLAIISPCEQVWQRCSWKLLMNNSCDAESAFAFILLHIVLILCVVAFVFGLYILIKKRYYNYCIYVVIAIILSLVIFVLLNGIIECWFINLKTI